MWRDAARALTSKPTLGAAAGLRRRAGRTTPPRLARPADQAGVAVGVPQIGARRAERRRRGRPGGRDRGTEGDIGRRRVCWPRATSRSRRPPSRSNRRSGDAAAGPGVGGAAWPSRPRRSGSSRSSRSARTPGGGALGRRKRPSGERIVWRCHPPEAATIEPTTAGALVRPRQARFRGPLARGQWHADGRGPHLCRRSQRAEFHGITRPEKRSTRLLVALGTGLLTAIAGYAILEPGWFGTFGDFLRAFVWGAFGQFALDRLRELARPLLSRTARPEAQPEPRDCQAKGSPNPVGMLVREQSDAPRPSCLEDPTSTNSLALVNGLPQLCWLAAPEGASTGITTAATNTPA